MTDRTVVWLGSARQECHKVYAQNKEAQACLYIHVALWQLRIEGLLPRDFHEIIHLQPGPNTLLEH